MFALVTAGTSLMTSTTSISTVECKTPEDLSSRIPLCIVLMVSAVPHEDHLDDLNDILRAMI